MGGCLYKWGACQGHEFTALLGLCVHDSKFAVRCRAASSKQTWRENLICSLCADLRYAVLKNTAFARRLGLGQPAALRVAANVSSEAACNQLCLQERQPGAASADNSNATVPPRAWFCLLPCRLQGKLAASCWRWETCSRA